MSVEVLTIRVFRREPGDVGVPDVAFPGGDALAARNAAKARLQNFFHEPTRRGSRKPLYAVLLGQDRRILAVFEMTMSGEARQTRGADEDAQRA